MRVLYEPKNSLFRQYQEVFAKSGSNLVVEDGALREIAREAVAKGTGARGLRVIMERLLLDAMFEVCIVNKPIHHSICQAQRKYKCLKKSSFYLIIAKQMGLKFI